MATEAQKRAAARYEKANVRRKVVKFFPKDADLLAHLEKQPSQNAYILDLIRRDIEQQQQRQSPQGATRGLLVAFHEKH